MAKFGKLLESIPTEDNEILERKINNLAECAYEIFNFPLGLNVNDVAKKLEISLEEAKRFNFLGKTLYNFSNGMSFHDFGLGICGSEKTDAYKNEYYRILIKSIKGKNRTLTNKEIEEYEKFFCAINFWNHEEHPCEFSKDVQDLLNGMKSKNKK